jgi:preprotein translocase subunit YajC
MSNKLEWLFPLGMILVMYVLFFLPQRRRQKELARMLAALKKGDQVVTTAGMRGEVTSVDNNIVTLRFHDNVRIDFDKSAIAQVVQSGTGA